MLRLHVSATAQSRQTKDSLLRENFCVFPVVSSQYSMRAALRVQGFHRLDLDELHPCLVTDTGQKASTTDLSRLISLHVYGFVLKN